MSMERCSRCSAQIDTDDDVECYVELPNYVTVAHPFNPGADLPYEVAPLCAVCRSEGQS